MNMNKIKYIGKIVRMISIILIAFSLVLFNSCKDKIVNPGPKPEPIPDSIPNPVLKGNYALCYTKSYNDHWEIFATNFKGTDPQNISNHPYDDEYPQWSPDGRYIVYSTGYNIYVYDTKNKTETNVTSDGGSASQNPFWTPNGKICFNYPYAYSKFRGTWIINPDGSNKQNILDSIATDEIYFYPDSFTFLYEDEVHKLHKTNIEHTFDDFILDIGYGDNYIPIFGFNPNTNELLIEPNDVNGLALFNINSKTMDIFYNADANYSIQRCCYSSDFSKIAIIEFNSTNGRYLSILENGSKYNLIRIPITTPMVSFGWSPIQFSPDDKYIAYSKQYWQNGDWVSWKEYLYIIDVNSGVETIVVEGLNPSWNPKP
ncbi:MAG: DPP IV N-terminal domain-containing protein [Ignavibacteriales bacterium]|nr:DPP IV N-terminal domain-containing protein [Ignavibacteriales bacterium]